MGQRRFHQIPSNLTEKHRLECPTSPQKQKQQQQSKMKFSKFFGLTSRTPTSSTNVEEAKAAEDRMANNLVISKSDFDKKYTTCSLLGKGGLAQYTLATETEIIYQLPSKLLIRIELCKA